MRPACACCSCSGSKLPGKTPCNLWPTMRFSFPPPPPPDDQNFPDPLSLSSSAAPLAGPRVRRPSFLLSHYSRHPSPVFSGFSFFFSFLLLKNGRTDGRTEKQQEKINKQRLPGAGCTHNVVVILACRPCVFRRTYFRNLAAPVCGLRDWPYFLFAEMHKTKNIKIIRFYITSCIQHRHVLQGPAHFTCRHVEHGFFDNCDKCSGQI